MQPAATLYGIPNEPTIHYTMKSLVTSLLLLSALAANAAIRYDDISVAVVAPCIAPLQNSPTQSTANQCAMSLTRASLQQTPQERTASQQLGNLISNLMGAEQRLLRARKEVPKAAQAARDAESRAQAWLKPNAFGSVNQVAYQNAVNAAQQIRPRADAELNAARENFSLLMRTTADTIQGLEQAHKREVSEPLDVAMQAVGERSKQSVPGENAEFTNQLAGGLAILGLLWVGSKLMSEGSSSQATSNPIRGSGMSSQQRYAEDEKVRQAKKTEDRLINEQQARWRAETMRPFR